MAMLRWEAFREIEDALRRFSPLYMPNHGVARDETTARTWMPLANISESEKEYLIRIELPGVKKEDVKIAVADGIITISGERKLEREDQGENAIRIASVYGAFPRSFVLPDYADANGIHAEVEDAACALTYPKPRLRNPNPWRSRFIESARKAGLRYCSAGSAGARALARAARAYGNHQGRLRAGPRNTKGERIMINSSTAPYAALILRLSLGILFLAHVALKIFVFTIPGFVGYFGSLGLPPILAYGVIALELLGGIALILGIYASWIAVPLALELLGSIFLVHGANGWLFTNKGGGWEYPAFWAVSLAVLYLLGDGAMALRPVGRKT